MSGRTQAEALSRSDERRSEPRGATVFRPVLIETEDFAGFCLVRNLSPNGMRAKVYTTFAAGQPIITQFNSDELFRGSLIWCEDDHIGVRFESAVDVAQILANLARRETAGKLNRPLRLPIHCVGELIIEGRSIHAEVQDISQRGVKILSSFVRPGDELTVKLGGLDQRKAIVRWSQPGIAGLNFLRPISFDELAQWVVKQHMGEDLYVDVPFHSSRASTALIKGKTRLEQNAAISA